MSEPTARDVKRWEKIIAAAREWGGVIRVEPAPPVMLPEREEEYLRQLGQIATELGIGLDESGDVTDADCERIAAAARGRIWLWPAEREKMVLAGDMSDIERALEYAVATGRAVRTEGGFVVPGKSRGEEQQ